MFVSIGSKPPTVPLCCLIFKTTQSISWGYVTEYGLIFTCFRGDWCFAEGNYYTFLLNAPVETIGYYFNFIIKVTIFPRLDTQAEIPVQLDESTLVDAIPIRHNLTYLFNASRL